MIALGLVVSFLLREQISGDARGEKYLGASGATSVCFDDVGRNNALQNGISAQSSG